MPTADKARQVEELAERFSRSTIVITADYTGLDVDQMTEAVRTVKTQGGGVLLEASGNVDLTSVKEIAKTGVDYISVGSLTHSVTALDISMLFQ